MPCRTSSPITTATGILQSPAQRKVKQKTSHYCALSNHETSQQDFTSWLSFVSGPAHWTSLFSPFSHRCIKPATEPRLSPPFLTDVFTRPASPRHHLPIRASDHHLDDQSSFKLVERASHPSTCQATSSARGGTISGSGDPCIVQPVRDRNHPMGLTLHEFPQP